MTEDAGSAARYVAIITDGNGRWAQQRGLPVIEGHRAGADVVKERLRDAVELGIEELTVFSFSTENWSRPREEVEGLMRMFGERIASETPELDEEGVRMRFIGRRESVGPELAQRALPSMMIATWRAAMGAAPEPELRLPGSPSPSRTGRRRARRRAHP